MQLGRNTFTPNGGRVVPAFIVRDVLNALDGISPEDVSHRLEDLSCTQPYLCAFITDASKSLQNGAAFPAALAGFAIVWMFEKHHQRALPIVTSVDIDRCLKGAGQSLVNSDSMSGCVASMSGKAQPFIHEYIADTVLDFERSRCDTDVFDLFYLLMTLKITVTVLHDAVSRALPAEPVPNLSAVVI